MEPWNSVRVTLSIPRHAVTRLQELAKCQNGLLRSLGILSVQIEGDQAISLTIVGQNQEPTQLIFRMPYDTNNCLANNMPAARSDSDGLNVTALQEFAQYLMQNGNLSPEGLPQFTAGNEGSSMRPPSSTVIRKKHLPTSVCSSSALQVGMPMQHGAFQMSTNVATNAQQTSSGKEPILSADSSLLVNLLQNDAHRATLTAAKEFGDSGQQSDFLAKPKKRPPRRKRKVDMATADAFASLSGAGISADRSNVWSSGEATDSSSSDSSVSPTNLNRLPTGFASNPDKNVKTALDSATDLASQGMLPQTSNVTPTERKFSFNSDTTLPAGSSLQSPLTVSSSGLTINTTEGNLSLTTSLPALPPGLMVVPVGSSPIDSHSLLNAFSLLPTAQFLNLAVLTTSTSASSLTDRQMLNTNSIAAESTAGLTSVTAQSSSEIVAVTSAAAIADTSLLAAQPPFALLSQMVNQHIPAVLVSQVPNSQTEDTSIIPVSVALGELPNLPLPASVLSVAQTSVPAVSPPLLVNPAVVTLFGVASPLGNTPLDLPLSTSLAPQMSASVPSINYTIVVSSSASSTANVLMSTSESLSREPNCCADNFSSCPKASISLDDVVDTLASVAALDGDGFATLGIEQPVAAEGAVVSVDEAEVVLPSAVVTSQFDKTIKAELNEADSTANNAFDALLSVNQVVRERGLLFPVDRSASCQSPRSAESLCTNVTATLLSITTVATTAAEASVTWTTAPVITVTTSSSSDHSTNPSPVVHGVTDSAMPCVSQSRTLPAVDGRQAGVLPDIVIQSATACDDLTTQSDLKKHSPTDASSGKQSPATTSSPSEASDQETANQSATNNTSVSSLRLHLDDTVDSSNPLMAPGFSLNLTESVQRVIQCIPTDSTTPPPSPKLLHPTSSPNTRSCQSSPHLSSQVAKQSPAPLLSTLGELRSVVDSATKVVSSVRPSNSSAVASSQQLPPVNVRLKIPPSLTQPLTSCSSTISLLPVHCATSFSNCRLVSSSVGISATSTSSVQRALIKACDNDTALVSSLVSSHKTSWPASADNFSRAISVAVESSESSYLCAAISALDHNYPAPAFGDVADTDLDLTRHNSSSNANSLTSDDGDVMSADVSNCSLEITKNSISPVAYHAAKLASPSLVRGLQHESEHYDSEHNEIRLRNRTSKWTSPTHVNLQDCELQHNSWPLNGSIAKRTCISPRDDNQEDASRHSGIRRVRRKVESLTSCDAAGDDSFGSSNDWEESTSITTYLDTNRITAGTSTLPVCACIACFTLSVNVNSCFNNVQEKETRRGVLLVPPCAGRRGCAKQNVREIS